MILSNCQMIRVRIELDAVDWRFLLESFDDLVHSVINDVDSAFLPSWDNVVSFAWKRVDIIFMNVLNFVLKRSDSQVPNTNLFVLTSTETDFIVLEGDVFDSIMSL